MSDETDLLASGHNATLTSPNAPEQLGAQEPDEMISRIERALLARRRLRIGLSELKDQGPRQAEQSTVERMHDVEEPMPGEVMTAARDMTVVSGESPARHESREASTIVVDHKSNPASSAGTKVVDDMMTKALRLTPAILAACAKAVQVAESKREATRRDYQAKFNRLTKTLGEPGRRANVDGWLLTLAPHHGATNSFKANRAALSYGLRQRIRELLTLQEELYTKSGHTPDWLEVVARLKVHLRILDAVKAAPHGAEFWKVHGGTKRTGTRKGADLRKLVRMYPDWRSDFLSAMAQTKYQDAAHVSDLVGCRPQELWNGACVRRVDGHQFSITIQGAKVGEKSGQEWRTLTFSNRVLPSCWANRLLSSGEIAVTIDSVAAYRQSERRISKRLFGDAPAVTPYTFRHAFRTQQAEEGGNEEDIGAAMGHSSAESQFSYGSPPAKGKKRVKPISRGLTAVQSARAVKPRDKSSLQSLLKKRGRPDA